MIKLTQLFFFFILGVAVTFYYFNKKENKNKSIQVQVLLSEIKNVSKLVVTESTFSEMYNYEDADDYLFETISFNKKVILSVNAKVQVSYDLSKMEIETDTINKKIIIKSIPEQEVFISPDISYFDLEQSSFNTFSKSELNSISKKSIEKIKETIDASTLKERSKNRLFEELQKIYAMATLLEWELVDETESKMIMHTLKL